MRRCEARITSSRNVVGEASSTPLHIGALKTGFASDRQPRKQPLENIRLNTRDSSHTEYPVQATTPGRADYRHARVTVHGVVRHDRDAKPSTDRVDHFLQLRNGPPRNPA